MCFQELLSENGVYFYNLEVLSFLLICVMELRFFYTLILLTCSLAHLLSCSEHQHAKCGLWRHYFRFSSCKVKCSDMGQFCFWLSDWLICIISVFPRSELIMYINNICQQLPDLSFLSWSFMLQCSSEHLFLWLCAETFKQANIQFWGIKWISIFFFLFLHFLSRMMNALLDTRLW